MCSIPMASLVAPRATGVCVMGICGQRYRTSGQYSTQSLLGVFTCLHHLAGTEGVALCIDVDVNVDAYRVAPFVGQLLARRAKRRQAGEPASIFGIILSLLCGLVRMRLGFIYMSTLLYLLDCATLDVESVFRAGKWPLSPWRGTSITRAFLTLYIVGWLQSRDACVYLGNYTIVWTFHAIN